MENGAADQDGFIMVKSKRRPNNSINNLNKNLKSLSLDQARPELKEPVYDDKELQKLVLNLDKKIQECKLSLLEKDENMYWEKLKLKFMKNIIESNDSIENMNFICYGLGSVYESLSSRYQLALLLLLLDHINQYNLESKKRKFKIDLVEFFDPVLNSIDKKLLTSIYGFKIADSNTKCMKKIDSNHAESTLTLFYMPHCPNALYNNLLYANWQPDLLNKLIILGNSFSTIHTMTLNSVMEKNFSYIKNSLEFLEEIRINSDCSLTNAFHDMSLHLFKTNINNFNCLTENSVPIYDNSISNEIF